MHGKRHRRIGDGSPCGTTYARSKQDICLLLDHIHGFYKAALDRLPSSLAPRLLKGGMCIGFLDPVSNIIANTLAYTPPSPSPSDDEALAPEWILSKIITDTNDESIFEVPLHRHKSDGMTLARRSLDGLITFLTSHFRYLPDGEALRYLRLARSDLVAAVRLIERDRPSKEELASFSIASLTTKVALECAAVSARHPQPHVLVKASLTMASTCMASVADITTFLAAGQDPPLEPATLKSLAELLRQANLSLHLTICGREEEEEEEKKRRRKKKRKRSEHTSESSMEGEEHKWRRRLGTIRYTQSLVRLLLGKIHGLYLQALAKLPRDGLRKRHHCSLLKGGYCYGPRDDPVSNIILNTIWYGSTFPTPQKFELQFKVDMICTDMLARIECCSLYGLVAFLRACFPSLTEHDAVWYLLSSDAHIRKAIYKEKKHGHALALCDDDLHSAYRQAAVASWHPDPDALVKFSTSSLNTKLLAILQQGTLTNGLVESLAMALPHKPPPTKSEELENQVVTSSSRGVLSKNQKRFISEFRKKFRQDQNFFVRKVNAALSDYSQQKGVHYKLRIICGVNPKVPDGPSVFLAKKNFKFEYFHINFLATIKGPDSAVTPPQLFFAQCSNSVKEMQARPSWCTPVSDSCIDNVRCYSCEFNGVRIVHPYDETYCGRYEDFNLMAHGKHGTGNDLLISAGHFNVDRMSTLTEDWIYFDPNMDSKIAEMNPISNVARELREWKGRIL